MGKYEALTAKLLARPEPEVTLTFDEIDKIVGGLPPSARTYREWWTNRVSSQPHSIGWLGAGRFAEPDFESMRTVFKLNDEASERLDPRPPAGAGTHSASGVWIADDFRTNLIIDRYDPVFSEMRASKLKHLRSENSEDAATWNAFRSLRQIDPSRWVPVLWQKAFPEIAAPADVRAVTRLWPEVSPPPALRDIADEGPTEVDVVIESPTWVWFIEAKLRSDISTGTTTRPDRDQVLRNLDVGTYFSGVRNFFFSLLISDHGRSPKGIERVAAYQDLRVVQSVLSDHRPDGLKNLQALGVLEWQNVGDVLASEARANVREDERAIARRAADWLESRGLWHRPDSHW